MDPLLVLSHERIAAEVRLAEERAADELEWRRRIHMLGLDCFLVNLDGLLLTLAGLSYTGTVAQLALCSGLLMGNALSKPAPRHTQSTACFVQRW